MTSDEIAEIDRTFQNAENATGEVVMRLVADLRMLRGVLVDVGIDAFLKESETVQTPITPIRSTADSDAQ